MNQYITRKFLFSFQGREGRKVFIIGYLAAIAGLFIVGFLFGSIFARIGIEESVSNSILVFLAAPFIGFVICLAVRRLHDIGLSGWWYLIMGVFSLIPVPFLGKILTLIALIALASAPGEKKENKYGKVLGHTTH